MTSPNDPSPSRTRESPLYCPVYFYHRRERVLSTSLDTTLEIGRQRDGEPAPPLRVEGTQGARVILTPIDDVEVSRSHVEVAPAAEGQVRVTNLSRTLPLKISPNALLEPAEYLLATPPVLMQFGNYAVRVDPPEEEDLALEGLPERTSPPGKLTDHSSLARFKGKIEEASLLQWLETVLGVFQSAASSHDFPEQAAHAVVHIVGLDVAAMLRVNDAGRWRVEAVFSEESQESVASWSPSQTLLARVKRERRTFRNLPPVGSDTPHSLQDVTALVAAPILDGEGNVIGALYGDRRTKNTGGSMPQITAFEAKLVELLASGIAAGLARLKEEQAALEARVQFEQFFTPQLAAQLQRDPQLLAGRDAEVTLLFADIRGFSRVSERLGPARTMDWIQDVMGVLSECVLEHDGVLVDYLGDEVMAMWGAPVPQADHASLACKAARRMIARLPEITERWDAELGEPLRLGIGINSGVARVGNTGSPLKFKYGPLGDVVNVASRVQGATKYLGGACLITGETLRQLPAGVPSRRLARVRAVNIVHPIDIYEIRGEAGPTWDQQCAKYNEALTALEREDLAKARNCVEELIARFGDDAVVTALADRIAAAAGNDSLEDASVWQLPGK
jgi:adenylate cyclase